MNNVTLSQKTKLFWIVGILSVVALALYVGMRIGRADADVIRPKESSTQNTDEQNIVSRPVNGEVQTYVYTEAGQHIGEYARVTGTVVSVYASKGGTTFIDFCKNYKTCPFTAVIFSSSANEFTDLKGYTGPITLTGTIKSYQGKAEIILDSRDQVELQ